MTEHHGPSPSQKEALREKQAHFLDRAKAIKEDESLTEDEKKEALHTLREHAMLYMGPHAILPHALMQKSPIPEVEEKRRELVRSVSPRQLPRPILFRLVASSESRISLGAARQF